MIKFFKLLKDFSKYNRKRTPHEIQFLLSSLVFTYIICQIFNFHNIYIVIIPNMLNIFIQFYHFLKERT